MLLLPLRLYLSSISADRFMESFRLQLPGSIETNFLGLGLSYLLVFNCDHKFRVFLPLHLCNLLRKSNFSVTNYYNFRSTIRRVVSRVSRMKLPACLWSLTGWGAWRTNGAALGWVDQEKSLRLVDWNSGGPQMPDNGQRKLTCLGIFFHPSQKKGYEK